MDQEIQDLLTGEYEERWLVYVKATPDGKPLVSEVNAKSAGGAKTMGVAAAAKCNAALAALRLPETAEPFVIKYAREVKNTIIPDTP